MPPQSCARTHPARTKPSPRKKGTDETDSLFSLPQRLIFLKVTCEKRLFVPSVPFFPLTPAAPQNAQPAATDGIVRGSRGQLCSVRTKRARQYRTGVSAESAQALSGVGIPQLDGLVIGSRGQLCPVRTKRARQYSSRVLLQGAQASAGGGMPQLDQRKPRRSVCHLG